MVTVDELAELGIKALQRAYQVHEKLGESGLEPVQANPHGETALRVDVEIEKVIIEVFREAKALVLVSIGSDPASSLGGTARNPSAHYVNERH